MALYKNIITCYNYGILIDKVHAGTYTVSFGVFFWRVRPSLTFPASLFMPCDPSDEVELLGVMGPDTAGAESRNWLDKTEPNGWLGRLDRSELKYWLDKEGAKSWLDLKLLLDRAVLKD